MADDSMTGIDIVIPNWNGRHMLEICLPSLYSQTHKDFDIIVVDNGSTDDSLDYIHTNFPEVKVIALDKNYGFSAAVNRGIESGCREWVLLLNNDIEMAPACLDSLAQQIDSNSEVRMYALKMLSFANRTMLDGAGDGVLRGGVGYRFGTLEPDSDYYSLRREVFGACGGAALYNRVLFDELGLFDEEFFAYLEDVDFNLRAVRAGYTCWYVPEAVVYHMGSATSGSKINKLTVRLTTRNNIFVLCKNYTLPMLIRFLPALLVYQFFWLLFVIKKRQFIAYMSGLFEAIPRMLSMARKKPRQLESTITISRFCEKIIASEGDVVKSIMARRRGEGKNNTLLRWYLTIFC